MRIEASETFRVAPDRLWPLLANTDSLNRELGLPNVDYTFTPLSQGGSAVRARTRVGLVTMEWDEHPFEWIWPREYSIRRVFHKGPMREFRAAFRFEPTGQGCRVGIQVDLEPAGFLGKLVAKPFGQKSLNQTIEATRNFVGISGVFSFSPTDHNGLDRRAVTMVEIANGGWRIAK